MRKTVRRLTDRRPEGLAADLADLFQNLTRGLFDTYRPELHYMRGPGPRPCPREGLITGLHYPDPSWPHRPIAAC